jgi:hypothetical protein
MVEIHMSRDAHIEESLLKFFYGECTVDELKDIHRELCDSEECYEYLESIAELLRLLKSAEEAAKTEQVNWDNLKSKFNRVLSVIEKDSD